MVAPRLTPGDRTRLTNPRRRKSNRPPTRVGGLSIYRFNGEFAGRRFARGPVLLRDQLYDVRGRQRQGAMGAGGGDRELTLAGLHQFEQLAELHLIELVAL